MSASQSAYWLLSAINQHKSRLQPPKAPGHRSKANNQRRCDTGVGTTIGSTHYLRLKRSYTRQAHRRLKRASPADLIEMRSTSPDKSSRLD